MKMLKELLSSIKMKMFKIKIKSRRRMVKLKDLSSKNENIEQNIKMKKEGRT
jgi:hypothetical protein